MIEITEMIDMNEIHDLDLESASIESIKKTRDLDVICTEFGCGPLTFPDCPIC